MTRRFITDPAIPSDAIFEKKRKQPVKRKGGAKVQQNKGRESNEQAIISTFLKNQTGPVTPEQVKALSTALGRTPQTIKKMMIRAREKFISKAGRYVEIHGEAVEGALLAGDHETAIKGAQWAMQNLHAEGVRIVDKPEATTDRGTKVLVGIQIGGVQESKVLVGQVAPSTPIVDDPPTPDEIENPE